MRDLTRATTLLLFAALLLLPSTADAQVVVGVNGGVNSSTFSGEAVADDAFDHRTGFHAGGFVAFPLSPALSLSVGGYYTQKGVENAAADLGGAVELDYVQVPVTLQLDVTDPVEHAMGLAFFAGPTVAFETTCEFSSELGTAVEGVDCEEVDVETNSVDVGLTSGVDVTFAVSQGAWIMLRGGAEQGLTSISDGEDEDVKNRTFFASAGLAFPLGG